MLPPRSSRCLLAASLALFSSPALAATCTRTIVANTGDSCTTVAATYGLTVTQFIQLNPTLGTCALTPSATYCVSDDPTAAPTSTSAPPTSSSLIPSPDGSEGVCGNGYTCLGSIYGDCCSQSGYCGNTTEYCGDGCNPLFGTCGGGVPPETSGGAGTTVTVTVSGGLATCTPATKTVTLGQSTIVQTATITRLQTVTLVPGTVTQATTITKLQTVTQTVTANDSAPAKPSPTLSGTYANCSKYYQWKTTDSCTRVLWTNGLSLQDFYALNTNFDCYNPSVGYYICVG